MYDFPEMFRQALYKIWKEFKTSTQDVHDVVTCVELVLNGKGDLVELNRLHGENEVKLEFLLPLF